MKLCEQCDDKGNADGCEIQKSPTLQRDTSQKLWSILWPIYPVRKTTQKEEQVLKN